MSRSGTQALDNPVLICRPTGSSSVVLVCEHASHHIPLAYKGLGLSQADLTSHAAWDPGALAVAQKLSQHLDAALVASQISRLVYDCNRPPHATDAMPERSEVITVPGNRDLSQAERDARVAAIYRPFHAALRRVIHQTAHPIIVTVHSFTPVYHGQVRSVEIGILHDSDARLADAMLQTALAHTTAEVQRNQPYGPEHGVTHTLQEHGVKAGHPNVMIEIRSDLIETATQQDRMAAVIAKWIADACAHLDLPADVQCRG